MLRSEIFDISSKKKYDFSFFDDDSIESVRSKIGIAVNVHPDRLFILIGLELSENYYKEDPRRWESLFERMSFNGEKIERDIFLSYQSEYREPNLTIPFYPYDRVEWMSKPSALEPILSSSDFLEYRIFGVEERKSFILPLNGSPLTSKIISANLPIPENTKLFNSFYEKSVRFLVKVHIETDLQVYFPLLRSTTPPNLSSTESDLILKNSQHLAKLIDLKIPDQNSITILRTRFYIPWIETDFGDNIRTKFEQIFYGLTVSEETPYIGFFTSKEQTSIHKFYTKDSKTKDPYIDMDMWRAWWSVKPARNVKTLILFRGESNHHYDRIAITATDMVISTYREEGNEDTINDLRNEIYKWIKTLDAIIPFIVERDIDKSRGELQDMSFVAKYSEKLEEFDLLRFDCLNTIFDMADKSKSQFSLLRSDQSIGGVSPIEVKIIQMLKDGRRDVAILSQDLSISSDKADQLIRYVERRLQDEPKLALRTFRGYPTMRVGPDFIVVSSVSNFEKSLQYANLLRFILSDPESEALNEICPKKALAVGAKPAVIDADVDEDAVVSEEYNDFFASYEEDEAVSVTNETIETTSETERVRTDTKKKTLYRYFAERLRKFDPTTFDPKNSKYPKKCEQKHQPLILTTQEVERLKPTEYNVNDYEKLDWANPEGTLICPPYWCMKDQIPLKEDQLDKTDGIRCPKCRGKLQTKATDDPIEFPLLKREEGFIFPGITSYQSPHNKKNMPCCYKTQRSADRKVGNEDKYYILSEEKELGEERLAKLPQIIIDSLKLDQNNSTLEARLSAGKKGFFRVGLRDLPKNFKKFIEIDKKPPSPREAIEATLRCSFVNTWPTLGTKHLAQIEAELRKFPQFKDDELLRTSLAKIISGIDEAYDDRKLTELQQLEYLSIAYQTDIFRIDLETMELGCMFFTRIVTPKKRAVVILQNDDQTDILTFVERRNRDFHFHSNIYSQFFTKETQTILERLRNRACSTKMPSYSDALNAIQILLPIMGEDDFQIILDPYGKGQAFYVPKKLILPFQSTLIPSVSQAMVSGYKDIPIEDLPTRDIGNLLERIQQVHSGYAFKEFLHNKTGIVEILLESGLRIPIQPIEEESENNEVIETIREFGETELVFGESSKRLRATQQEISYSAEIYDFLLFQLTNDLQNHEYESLRNALVSGELEELLRRWFDSVTQFVELRDPKKFISKIRKPCNETCDGELCAMDGDKCKVQINSTINNEKIFRRVLKTLKENSKIRSMVLDGRSTPFFSTILYLQLPHELIVTDNQLPE